MTIGSWVFFKGAGAPGGGIVLKDKVCISPNDRGFLLGDGVYEVMRSYAGRLFRPRDHLARLKHSLMDVRIGFDDVSCLEPIALDLLKRNRLGAADATVYIQITRGVHPRMLMLPAEPLLPTVYVETCPCAVSAADSDRGVSVITVTDVRWSRCDIKAIGLLPNVLARMQATEAGAAEAVFVRDGLVTEGTHTNVFGVLGGTVITHAADNYVLAGITRGVVLELCGSLGIPVSEAGISEVLLPELDELFLAATTAEVTPIAGVNGRPVGNGHPGPVTRRLQAAFRDYVVKTLAVSAQE